MNKHIFFKNLDALRFFCFLSVFLFHSFHTENYEIKNSELYHFIKSDVFGNGNLGVNFFFVLSGFLITFLLIEEKKIKQQINLKKFWLRRILRIWPLFFFCVFFGFIVFPILKSSLGDIPNETANPIYYLTFLNNFDFIKNGLPDASVLGVLWSVAIEEQFYLFWPIVIFIFPISRLWIPFLIILCSTFIFRAIYNSYLIHEYHTFSCIGDMTIGAFGAWFIQEKNRFKEKIINLNKLVISFIYILFILIFFFRDEFLLQNEFIRIFERSFIAIVILFVILEQNYAENSIYKLGKLKTLSKLGTITYGLYCLHFIGILIVTKTTGLFNFNSEFWQVMLLETILSLLISIVIAKISYRFFEKPFLKIKERFSF